MMNLYRIIRVNNKDLLNKREKFIIRYCNDFEY